MVKFKSYANQLVGYTELESKDLIIGAYSASIDSLGTCSGGNE